LSEQTLPQFVWAKRLYDGSSPKPQENALVELDNGRIRSVQQNADPGDALQAEVVSPGFIDIQINGANDVQFNDDPSVAAIEAIAVGARDGGTAHLLPTFITAPDRDYLAALDAVREALSKNLPGILGVHLEGPFLSPKRPGVHPPECIRALHGEDADTLTADMPGVCLLTLAPEEAAPGMIKRLCDAGVVVFAGHSAATSDEMDWARAEGLSGATHLFNAMSQITVRDPGVAGAIISSPDLFAGIIADGLHVHPKNLDLARRMMGGRLCLVTDAMKTLAGSVDTFELFDRTVHKQVNRLTDANGTLAGAHLAMDEAVRNMIRLTGASEGEALLMASTNAARAIGVEGELGQIKPGYRASMTLLTGGLEATGVMVDGQHFERRKNRQAIGE